MLTAAARVRRPLGSGQGISPMTLIGARNIRKPEHVSGHVPAVGRANLHLACERKRLACVGQWFAAIPPAGKASTHRHGATSSLLPKHADAHEMCRWAWQLPLQVRGEPWAG